VTLLYEHGVQLRIRVKRARVARPRAPDALTVNQQNKVEHAAARRGARDAAIVAVLLYAGARVEECARLDLEDIAITARTGEVRLHGNGDQVRSVPLPAPGRKRGNQPGPLWPGQRGRLTISGITQVVRAVGADGGIDGLRPQRLRHTYGTRLRQGGADVAQVQALFGLASLAVASGVHGRAEEQVKITEVARADAPSRLQCLGR
jgi:integrase